MRIPTARLFRVALAASLSVSALLFFLWSWRWPLVGDCSLIHYIAWLIGRGWAPYRQIGDMNMPGAYLVEMAAMHIFGTGALGWRLYDFSLMAATALSFWVITHRARASVTPVADIRPVTDVTPGTPSITVSSLWLGSEDRWLAGLFAACLFLLIHGRDGLAQGGQRDLTMAVCLIVATAFLFVAIRRSSLWAAAAFGLFSGVALTIKPTALPLTVAQLALAALVLRWRRQQDKEARPDSQRRNPPRSWRTTVVAALAGYLVAPCVVLAFLLRERAFTAFLDNLRGLDLYYAGLAHRPPGFLLLHSVSPLLPLVLIWFAVLALRFPAVKRNQAHAARESEPSYLYWERTALLFGAVFGLLSYLIQARGFPYYRYPLLIFLLPLMALDFIRALPPRIPAPLPKASISPHASSPPSLHSQPRTSRPLRIKTAAWLALVALAFGGFFLAPQSAVLLHRYRWWQTDFISSLQQNLDALGGQRLSRHIQCIDSISGCGTVLYRMRLQPANGLLVDFPLFGADRIPFVRRTRQHFLAAISASPPQVIVVTSALYVDGPGDYRKLARWPAFAAFLATRYTLDTEWTPTRATRWWSRAEMPASYRIYLLRPQP